MANTINRRKFLRGSAISATGIALGSNLLQCSIKKEQANSNYSIMQENMKYRKIDTHAHVYLYHGGPEVQIDFADRLGIEKMVISKPVTRGKGTPEEFIESNNLVLKAMKMFPDRFIGQPTLNPVYQKESLEEIKRCIDLGMVGLKLYTQVKINDPLFYPIIEKYIDLKMIILMHAVTLLGMGGYRMKYDKGEAPNTSIPEDFVDIAKRYPEAMFQFAHIGGGGDWEYECKMLKDYPNVYVDTSGSNNEENMIDFAVKTLGEDRCFFGTDSSYYQGVGIILASKLTEVQKKKLFFENYNNILKKGGNGVA
jgi:uncharacterized protein